MIFAVLIGFASAAVFFWSAVKGQEVSDALIDSYPPEFREPVLWRTGFHVFVLSPSTPVVLQAAYLQSLAGFCFVTLGVSLCCFILGQIIVGWIVLIMFFSFTVLTIKSWTTYRANCNRKTSD